MVRIVENSLLARIAAKVLNGKNMAITFGRCIYLHHSSREELIGNPRWLRHELKHVEQYQRMGFFSFLIKYLWYSIRHGYYLNPLEIEARLAEEDEEIIGRHHLA